MLYTRAGRGQAGGGPGLDGANAEQQCCLEAHGSIVRQTVYTRRMLPQVEGDVFKAGNATTLNEAHKKQKISCACRNSA